MTEHLLRFLSLKGDCTGGSSESTLVKMPHCWKSHVVAQILFSGFEIRCYVSIQPTQLQSLARFFFLILGYYIYHKVNNKGADQTRGCAVCSAPL